MGCMTKLNRNACLRQVREAPVNQMTLLASSDEHAGQHAALLARRPSLHAVSILRWAARECSDEDSAIDGMGLRLPAAPLREHTANAAVDSLTPALRRLVIGVFALTHHTIPKIGRCATSQIRTAGRAVTYIFAVLLTRLSHQIRVCCDREHVRQRCVEGVKPCSHGRRLTSLSSLTLQTAGHNAHMLARVSALRRHPSLLQLRLLHHRSAGQPAEPPPMQLLPHRLTSLSMHNWGCDTKALHMNEVLAGAKHGPFGAGALPLSCLCISLCHPCSKNLSSMVELQICIGTRWPSVPDVSRGLDSYVPAVQCRPDRASVFVACRL